MDLRCGILSLILLLNSDVSGSLSEAVGVTCSSRTICALQESAVNLTCSYPDTIKPQLSFWFSSKQKAKWRNQKDPEDLALDSDYAGRVRYSTRSYSSTLTVTDLRARDSGEYQLMLIAETGEEHLSAAVALTVSDVQVRTTPHTSREIRGMLRCSTSCNSTPVHYNWYKNGQMMHWMQQKFSVSSSSPDSYSCSANKIRSSAECMSDDNCWSVTYSDRRMCALEGSSVDFPCTYSYPSNRTVTKVFWSNLRPKVEPSDLSVEEQFAGRVEFLGDKERNCTLRMRNVTKSDSGEYFFRFFTDAPGGRFSGKPGVILSVTDLQVNVSHSTPSQGQIITLTCISTCTLPNNLTYMWYKNGWPVTNKPTRYNKLYLESASSEDALQYSCALGGPGRNTVLKLFIVGGPVLLTVALSAWMLIRRMGSRSDDKSEQQCNVSALRGVVEDQDDVHYSTLHFKPYHAQKEAPTYTLPVYTGKQDVEYAAVNLSRHSAATQALDACTVEDPSQTYSQVQKRKSPT